MTARFVACVACGRHVKEGDVACPFCGTDAPHVEPLPRQAGVRMTRAAMIAAGTAGALATIIDCGQSQPVPFYGVVCTGSECIPGGEDAALVDASAGDASDAAHDAQTDAPDAGED
jgi:hypothetical protein